jgi:hypothetical protein
LWCYAPAEKTDTLLLFLLYPYMNSVYRRIRGVVWGGGVYVELKTERFTVEDIRGCRRGEV